MHNRTKMLIRCMSVSNCTKVTGLSWWLQKRRRYWTASVEFGLASVAGVSVLVVDSTDGSIRIALLSD